MNLLRRSLAPVPAAAWTQMEHDVREALAEHLVARRVVDFDGPHGLELAAVNLGSLEPAQLGGGSSGGLRRVQPLFEVRVRFALQANALDDVARGAPDFDTSAAVAAARQLAELEDEAVLKGLSAAQIHGLSDVSTHPALQLGEDPTAYADVVARALLQLDDVAVGGPYALLLGSAPYRLLAGTALGYPPLQHLTKLLGSPVLHSRVLEGGLLVSLRGGDFTLTVGQDAAIGYSHHDAGRIDLFLVESFTFLALSPEAVVRLT